MVGETARKASKNAGYAKLECGERGGGDRGPCGLNKA